jgi:SAM-dependent methyltransferase
MSIATEYQKQFEWRDWKSALDAIPDVRGQTVLDLGCGVGDLSAELVARGAHVIGIDGNEALLDAARSRRLRNAEFRLHDLSKLPDLGVKADGIWCSFTAAFFPDLSPTLVSWSRHLRPGSWIALTEIDDLFAHEPLSERPRSLFEAYAIDALVAKRYDFKMGRNLRAHLERVGFMMKKELVLADQEFSFHGAARADVLEGWRMRLDRMKLFHEFCGEDFAAVRDEFLGCLARPDHRSRAKVCFCLARPDRPIQRRPSDGQMKF